MTLHRPLLNLILASALASALTACGSKESPQGENSTQTIIRIGAVQPLTGPQSHLGKDNENGTRMALDDANAKGLVIGGKPVRFELVSEDDQADPRAATIVAQKLADARVSGVIGHLNSGTSIPASRIYHEAGIVQISPSATNPKFTQQGFKTAFRVMPNDIQQGSVLGEFSVKKLGATKIAIIDDRTAYGQGLADQFEMAAKKAGATIVAREFTTDKSTDFMAVLTAIKGKDADLIFFGGMDAQGGPMLKQVKSLAIKSIFLTGDGGSTPEFIKLAGSEAAEGAYSSLPGLPIEKMPGGKDFAERFKKKYGEIQLYAPYCYDAVTVMIAAMQKADSTDPAKYQSALATMAHEGVTAKLSFDEKGDILNGAITLYQVRNGQWAVVETVGNSM